MTSVAEGGRCYAGCVWRGDEGFPLSRCQILLQTLSVFSWKLWVWNPLPPGEQSTKAILNIRIIIWPLGFHDDVMLHTWVYRSAAGRALLFIAGLRSLAGSWRGCWGFASRFVLFGGILILLG